MSEKPLRAKMNFSLEFFVVVELALAIGKPANHGRSYIAVFTACQFKLH